MRLHEAVALITGAGSGIGRAIALEFAGEGASVLLVARNAEPISETARLVAARGGQAEICCADVSKSADAERMVAACINRFGRIDILCNNAGVGSTQTVVETPDDVWDRVMDVNARGTFLTCKHAIPHMVRSGGGAIVNISSVAGLVGLRNRAAYCASKGAIVSLTRAIALDHAGQNVRCNCLCPGTVEGRWIEDIIGSAAEPDEEREALLQRHPVGRLARPEEIARAALYLASEDAAYVTGTALIIDGGLTAG